MMACDVQSVLVLSVREQSEDFGMWREEQEAVEKLKQLKQENVDLV